MLAEEDWGTLRTYEQAAIDLEAERNGKGPASDGRSALIQQARMYGG